MIKPKPTFIRFTNDGVDMTSNVSILPFYVSPMAKLKDWWYGHDWINTKEKYNWKINEVRCDRCWIQE